MDTGQWSFDSNLNQPRNNAECIGYHDQAFVFGGTGGLSFLVQKPEIYNPHNKTWTYSEGAMSWTTSDTISLILVDDDALGNPFIYVAGGVAFGVRFHTEMLIYDIILDTMEYVSSWSSHVNGAQFYYKPWKALISIFGNAGSWSSIPNSMSIGCFIKDGVSISNDPHNICRKDEPIATISTAPSISPSAFPSIQPSIPPSRQPTIPGYTYDPTNVPSISPTNNEILIEPTNSPSLIPTISPTLSPIISPTLLPTNLTSIITLNEDPRNNSLNDPNILTTFIITVSILGILITSLIGVTIYLIYTKIRNPKRKNNSNHINDINQLRKAVNYDDIVVSETQNDNKSVGENDIEMNTDINADEGVSVTDYF